ncbi:hypothetical protein ABBQ32_006644 [Trebouxia sp. C0010 RCD-2024]
MLPVWDNGGKAGSTGNLRRKLLWCWLVLLSHGDFGCWLCASAHHSRRDQKDAQHAGKLCVCYPCIAYMSQAAAALLSPARFAQSTFSVSVLPDAIMPTIIHCGCFVAAGLRK